MEGVAQRHRPGDAGEAPPSRDLFIDLVRVASMAAVVVLHWLSVMPNLVGGMIVDVNVVDVEQGLWPLTWIGDVMALFFFVGGYANWVSLAHSHDRGESRATFVLRRYRRLLRPTFAFLGVWLAIDLLALAVGERDLSPLRHVSTGNTIPFGPLWFIGVYLVVIALAPWTVAAHLRWRVAVPVAMAMGVAIGDAVAFASNRGTPMAANLVLVWLVPHQLGYFYADGTLRRLSPSRCAALAAAGLVGVALLTSLPYYPRSLVAIRWKVLIMGAPMLSLVASAVWLVGLALLLRPVAERMLVDERRRRVLAVVNGQAMPVFLWHMTAYLIAASTLAWLGAGFVYRSAPDADWWWGRPVLLVTSALALSAILAVLRSVRGLARRRTSDAVSP